MSTNQLPALPGLGYPWTRKPIFKTRRPTSVSGKEVRIADWSTPRYQWELTYNFLRQGTLIGTWTEWATLFGFFQTMLGGYDSFLYTDPDDYTVTGQGLGTTDGSTTAYQLVRALGGYVSPILAPNLSQTVNVYLNGGSPISSSLYSISQWGSAVPGILTFGSAPTSGKAITIDYQYFWPVRFDDDSLSFEKFMVNLWDLKKMSFTSIK